MKHEPVAHVRAHVVSAWTPARAEAVHRALNQRLTRGRHRPLTFTMGMLAAAAGVFFWLQTRLEVQPLAPSYLSQAGALPAGVQVRSFKADENPNALTKPRVAPDARAWDLLGAHVQVDVAAAAGAPFSLYVQSLFVQVLSASFVVQQSPGQVAIEVLQGHVQVQTSNKRSQLHAGQSFTWPPRAPAATTPPASATNLPSFKPAVSANRPAPQAWQRLAQGGRFDEAFTQLQRSLNNHDESWKDPGDLLLAADAARLSHHPAEALPHLERFVKKFNRDPRASLAAFTMGLVLLEELGRPKEAANAFALSRRLSPRGDLAEDALARQVEASFKAGDVVEAQRAAKDYLQAFPAGRRSRAVKRFGALE